MEGQCDHNAAAWFSEHQAAQVMTNGFVPDWFHGIISRKAAEELLVPKPPGYFLIRVSESREGYTLSYRAEDRCRHFMVDVLPDNHYLLVGEDIQHNSLHDLVAFHRRFPICPYNELLTVACGQESLDKADYADLVFPWRPTAEPGPGQPEPASQDMMCHSAPGVPPRLYPCLETAFGDFSIENRGHVVKPSPRPRTTFPVSNAQVDAPPAVPARINVPQGMEQVPNEVNQSTDLKEGQPTRTNGQNKETQSNKPAKIRKMFKKKKRVSEEQTYAEISDLTTAVELQGKDSMQKSKAASESQSQETPRRSIPVDGTIKNTGLPSEYLQPPPFAPGYDK